MFTSKTLLAGPALLIAVAMMTLPARVAADRSFYAPGPFNYPGLLPRFGGSTGDTAQALNGGSGSRSGSRSSADDALSTRFGETDDNYDRVQRIKPSITASSGSRQYSGCVQNVPCYDCIVYISRTGQITRYNPASQNELVRY